jgi:hypothetical protein
MLPRRRALGSLSTGASHAASLASDVLLSSRVLGLFLPQFLQEEGVVEGDLL